MVFYYMHIPRIFFVGSLVINSSILLPPQASIHVSRVLRLKVGSNLILFNNTDGEYYARIIASDHNQVTAKIESFNARQVESPLKIHLGQGISRGEKMDFTIQKAVELGVFSITPLVTEFGNVKLEGERLQNRMRHWQAVAVSAAEQSGRCYVPQILPVQKLAAWVKTQNNLGIILEPSSKNSLHSIEQNPLILSLLVGCEGGLAPAEIECAKQQEFLSLSLGPRILRTETAALVAISILQARWGDL